MPAESPEEHYAPRSTRLATTLIIALVVVIGALVGLMVFRLVASERAESSISARQDAGNPSAGPTAVAGPTVVPTQGPVQSEIKPVDPTYAVQPGDTLGSIARRFNTSIEALQSINNLPDRNSLRVGQQLVIP